MRINKSTYRGKGLPASPALPSLPSWTVNKYRIAKICGPPSAMPTVVDYLEDWETKKMLNALAIQTDLSTAARRKTLRIELLGMDGLRKYTKVLTIPKTRQNLEKALHDEMQHIYELVRNMPYERIRQRNQELYTDANPERTILGLGFKDRAKALYTIDRIKDEDPVYQARTIRAMYYRALHHPHRTPGMEAAMEVFEDWLAQR